MTGILSKLRPRQDIGLVVDVWQQRFFVLCADRLLYFKSHKQFKCGKGALGVIQLKHDGHDRAWLLATEDLADHEFIIRTPFRDFQLRCPQTEGQDLLQSWFEAFASVGLMLVMPDGLDHNFHRSRPVARNENLSQTATTPEHTVTTPKTHAHVHGTAPVLGSEQRKVGENGNTDVVQSPPSLEQPPARPAPPPPPPPPPPPQSAPSQRTSVPVTTSRSAPKPSPSAACKVKAQLQPIASTGGEASQPATRAEKQERILAIKQEIERLKTLKDADTNASASATSPPGPQPLSLQEELMKKIKGKNAGQRKACSHGPALC